MSARQTLSINFMCRKSKRNRKGLAPVEMIISINEERVNLTLPRKEYPEIFQKLYNQKKDNEIKNFCYAFRANIQNKITEMVNLGIPISAYSVKEYYLKNTSVFTIEDLFVEYFSSLVKRQMSRKNYNKYVHMRDEFFMQIDKKQPASKIDNLIVSSFQKFLATKFQPSTISGYLSRLKSVVSLGMAKGEIQNNPFYNIKIDRRLKVVTTITYEEYLTMRDKQLTNERLRKVRDYFVFACNCGLSYCDVVKLSPKDFDVVDGITIINKERVKTKVDYYSVVLDDGVTILEKYNYDLSALFLSNQKLNSYAKELADICGITSVESLHSHLCRHFYLTRIINSGVPIEIVSKCAGHSRISMTLHYARQLKQNVINDVVRAFK